MKMKMVTALFVLSLGTTASFAQTGASDGSRFGHGEDSIRCLKNISIYTEYVKTNNFKEFVIQTVRQYIAGKIIHLHITEIVSVRELLSLF